MIKSIYSKLILWGTSKEYPSIISVLFAIIFPIVGMIFVGNQMSFKTDENGKAHGLFLFSIIISLLWWGALITLLIIFI